MAKHGGNIRELAQRAGRPADEILDFSANINPLGPPECLRSVVSRNLERVIHYPDPESADLVRALAGHYRVPAESVIAGNGSTEIIYAIPRAVRCKRMVVPVPSYSDYANAARLADVEVKTVPLDEAEEFAVNWAELEKELRAGDAVILGQPNNPTGRMFDAEAFRHFAAAHPDVVFVVDEAFADFVPGYESLARDLAANVIVLCSLTKFYAVPGLRLGCAVAGPETAEQIRKHIQPWSVNVLAQAVGAAMLGDLDYAARTRELVGEQRERMTKALKTMPGLRVYPGAANFLLVRIDRPGLDAASLAERLLRRGIAVRVCGNFEGLDGRFFRVAVRTPGENDRLLEALGAELSPVVARPAAGRKTPAIMFQGTSSNAGKSVLAAAFCRILLQDGFRAAPFKAQNMSLNSFVTRDGGEMGRAQVVQARACRLEPDVRMNPVLLKPSSDTGCQVIVRGRPVDNMNVGRYVDYKAKAFEAARECYDSLAGEYDAVVLEGAGSPAEVNLKHHDIVNMKMARYAGAPVLLVGDIDRGGVYASFVGTMEVLDEWERELIRGFVVNRFRGDASLLGPAHDFVLRHTGRPVLGVVPYLRDLGLPEEDSVEFKSGALDRAAPAGESVEIAVIDLPHISNFTDFDALKIEPDVHVRIVRSPAELGRPDAVILPGSKNVLGDLAYLRSSGLAERIRAIAEGDGAEIVGVCGGYQMLGEKILDPHRIESESGSAGGLSLLPLCTVLAREKTLVRVSAVHLASGRRVAGYEIHHGQTEGAGLAKVLRHEDGALSGVTGESGRVWGTYLHGIFDADEFRRWFIDRLRARKGLHPLGEVAARYDIEPALDRLAGVVREALPVDEIYRLMGLK